MFVPAHNEKLMTSASKINADVLLLDIEDSVQPRKNKQVARDTIIRYIEQGKFKNRLLFPRVNDRESGELLKDVYQLTIDGINGFTYPKAKRGEDIYFFGKLLETIEYEKGYPIGTFKIIPLIETTSAVLNIQEICTACPSRVVAIAFGCEDFVTDLQGVHDNEGLSIYNARTMIAMAARAHNIIPIDTVHIKVHDLDDLERNLKIAKILGFEGMLILNPKELPLAHKYFSPSPQEINDAKEMLDMAKDAESKGQGVSVRNGKFIGPPMVLAAKKVLRKADLIKNNILNTKII
ncbi:MAG TPA: CoA ester lyase [Epulopiscium sp.]|nr:CoA ester lyase [Candidatus Epulonipiscium sp.]